VSFTIDKSVVGFLVFEIRFFVVDVLGLKGNQNSSVFTPIQRNRLSLSGDNIINGFFFLVLLILFTLDFNFGFFLLFLYGLKGWCNFGRLFIVTFCNAEVNDSFVLFVILELIIIARLVVKGTVIAAEGLGLAYVVIVLVRAALQRLW
jgi:hypothetical protein